VVVNDNPLVVDAAKDAISRALIPLAVGGLQDAGPMALSPNKLFTLLYSPANNTMAVITNQQETIAGGPTGTTLPAITLSAATESFFIWIDNATAFVAMPTAPVTGMQPGLVDRLSLGTASISARIPIAGARYLAESHNGNRILALSDNTGLVTVISPSLIGDPTGNPLTPVCCFDHPAGAVFSADDSTAYIFECGAECGGVRAAVTPLDLTTNTAGTPIPVDGATTGFISGNLDFYLLRQKLQFMHCLCRKGLFDQFNIKIPGPVIKLNSLPRCIALVSINPDEEFFTEFLTKLHQSLNILLKVLTDFHFQCPEPELAIFLRFFKGVRHIFDSNRIGSRH